MPPAKKRKLSTEDVATENEIQAQAPTNEDQTHLKPSEPQTSTSPSEPQTSNSPPPDSQPTLSDRQARFKELKARAQKSSQRNLKEAAAESARLSTDPNALTTLQRKQAVASHNLLKAETEAEGGDFERKRAWDWTIEESERWDSRMEKKARRRDDVAFQDYTQDAKKIYKRQLRDMKPEVEAYEKQKADMVQRAARSGGLEIVETADGEVVAVDRSNSFYADGQGTDFVDNKPEKAAVDRLVKDIQKAEESRLKKRRARGQEDDGEDITFINEKNKQFNQKLARFYNKYTPEIRESFERGTMI